MQSHKLSKKSLYLKIPFGFSVDYDVAKKKNPCSTNIYGIGNRMFLWAVGPSDEQSPFIYGSFYFRIGH